MTHSEKQKLRRWLQIDRKLARGHVISNFDERLFHGYYEGFMNAWIEGKL